MKNKFTFSFLCMLLLMSTISSQELKTKLLNLSDLGVTDQNVVRGYTIKDIGTKLNIPAYAGIDLMVKYDRVASRETMVTSTGQFGMGLQPGRTSNFTFTFSGAVEGFEIVFEPGFLEGEQLSFRSDSESTTLTPSTSQNGVTRVRDYGFLNIWDNKTSGYNANDYYRVLNEDVVYTTSTVNEIIIADHLDARFPNIQVSGFIPYILYTEEIIPDVDTDGDGIPDNIDLDDDNDGILDVDENECQNIGIVDYSKGTYTISKSVGALSTDKNYIEMQTPSGDSSPLGDTPYITAYDAAGGRGELTFTFDESKYITVDENGIVNIKFYLYDNSASLSGNYVKTNRNVKLFTDQGELNASFIVSNAEASVLDAGGWVEYTIPLSAEPNSLLEVTGFVTPLEVSDVNGGTRSTFNASKSEVYASVVEFISGGDCEGTDSDGDGIPNSLDTDSDNDGIPDLIESGLSSDEIAELDKNNDGIIDADINVGTNGVADTIELNNVDGGTSSTSVDYNNDGVADLPVDTDNDNIPDSIDLDSDNDGINDVIEAGIIDANGDGQDDTPNTSFANVNNLPDTDGDSIYDFRDVDSDNDGITDLVEGGTDPALDTNNDGVIDNTTDSDNDGIVDVVDNAPNTFGDNDSQNVTDTDGDGVEDFRDLDSDDDGINDVEEAGIVDANGDGQDDTPNTSFADGTNLPDSNNNGTPDYQDPNGAVITGEDTDGDGIKDSVDGLPEEFGDAPTTTSIDTDGDGIPDDIDLDDDNDGIPDSVENATATNNGDTDGDGIPDSLDLDSDNDGISDLKESGIPSAQIVVLDTNNDGVIDSTVAVGTNGIADSLEPSDTDGGTNSSVVDYDNDGTNDTAIDTDGDGIPNFQDLDSDNDGISDLVEGGTDVSLDENNDGVIDDTTDTDNDGIADVIDSNTSDFGGLDPNKAPDTDGDGVDDYRDLDSDDDGINDVTEANIPDTNGDGQDDTPNTSFVDGNNLPDSNADGIPDYQEPNGAVITGEDTDGDGIKDSVDGLPNEFGDAVAKGTVPDLEMFSQVIPNVLNGEGAVSMIFGVREVLNADTTSAVVVSIPNNLNGSYESFDDQLTELSGVPVKNSEWFIFPIVGFDLYVHMDSIEGLNTSNFGIKFNIKADDAKISIFSNIQTGSGGDSDTSNNTSVSILEIQ